MSWLLRKIILFFFWGSITFTVLLAILSVSIGKLIPYLENYRPQIESNLQQIIGYPVTLGRINGRLEGIDPTISIENFRLLIDETPVVSIDQIRVRLNVRESILSLSPQFTYIRFLSPAVSLQENDGAWRLSGGTIGNNNIGATRVLDYLSAQRNFSILNAKVHVSSEQFGEHNAHISHIYLFQKEFGSLLSSTFYLDDYKSPFKIDARMDKANHRIDDYRIKASIQSPLISLPPQVLDANPYSLSSLEVGGDVWLDILVGKGVKLQVDSTHFNVSFSDGQKYDITTAIKLNYSLKNPRLRFEVDNLKAQDDSGKQYIPTDFVFDWSSVSNHSIITFDQVDMSLGRKIGSYFLPKESNAYAILNGLSPTGTAKNGSIHLTRENDELSFQYLSDLQSASIEAYKGIPKATNINAVFGLSKDAGYIDFKGVKSDVHFDVAYDDVWTTDYISGYVSWNKQQSALLIKGRDLLVKRNGADLDGGFRVEIRENAPDWISLDLHGRNISISDRLTYIPSNALNSDLRSWIGTAFSETGQADEVNVLVQGELIESTRPHVRVRVEASDLEIAFDENWPTAKQVRGIFDFDDAGVSVQVESAYLLSLPVTNLAISVPINNGSADWLNVKGGVDDDSSVILAMLENTPLIDSVLRPFSNWEIAGAIEGGFDVWVPFVKDIEPKVEIDLDFTDNPLLIKDLNLPSIIERGRLHYSSSMGVTDSEFDIYGLGGQSHLVLSSNSVSNNEPLVISGKLSGTADARLVAEWQKLPEAIMEKISGESFYSGELTINQARDGEIDLVINSDLIGVGVDFPEPIGKNHQESKLLQVELVRYDGDIVVDVDYNDLFNTRFLIQDSALFGGEIIFNKDQYQNFSPEIPSGLSISGDFEYFDVMEWLPVITDLSTENSGGVDHIETPYIPEWVSQIDIIVDEVVINPYNTLHNFKASYGSTVGQPLLVNSDEINFSLTKRNNLPDLHFNFLSWNTDSTASYQSVQTKAPISARQIPNMSVSVDQFYLNDRPYGDWQFNISREENLIRVEPITSKLTSGHFEGKMSWLDSEENSNVKLNIVVSGKDVAELTEKFSNEAFLSSDEYNLTIDLGWEGHPFHFSRETALGQIDFSSEDGVLHQADELPVFLKVLGIFNVRSLARRLTLDFSDVYTSGLTYDSFVGTLALDNGILKTTTPILIDSPTANILLEGETNIVTETLDKKLTASFPVTGVLPLAGLLWSTPQIAGLLFIADMLIGDQVSKMANVEYKIEGSFDNPKVTPVQH